MALGPGAQLDSHDTAAGWSPAMGLVGPERPCGCAGQRCLGRVPSRGRRGLGRAARGAWRGFTFALPPEMSFEQRVLRLKLRW